MMLEHHWRVPDRIYIGLAAFVILLTAAFVGWSYSQLPDVLPLHVGPTGTPDVYANQKFLTLFLPVLLQLLIAFMVSWAYRHPRYFHFPSRRRLESFTTESQAILITLARHVLAMTLLLSSLIMSYLALATVMIGLDMTDALDGSVLVFLVLFLLLVVGAYLLWMRQVMRSPTVGTPSV